MAVVLVVVPLAGIASVVGRKPSRACELADGADVSAQDLAEKLTPGVPALN